ncbi:hypothetical protein FDA33_06920 [Clostridium botulinum]|nr:hypothetical protein [Clostridium botulinum]NFI19528.1 hypothetical protein [Clostridium botulinum]NFL94069.1 hypothetical protein [Clostridium botulinum]NFN50743.1 hypothetical protein [Clostridium botulinum]NFO27026.1 hypothetical protein [Clostridium botulinum]
MGKCIILGNEFQIRQAKKRELADGLKCAEEDVEAEIEEYPKVGLIYADIFYGIGGEEIQLSKNPGVYSILGEDKAVAISGELCLHEKVYEISVFEKNYGEENEIKTIEIELNIEHEVGIFDEDFYNIKVKIKECVKDYYKEAYFIEDTQNEKICIELYKMVYNNENKFRSIINKYMVITYGANWFNKVIDKAYTDSVLNLNKWYREQPGAEFKNVKGELYNLLIDDLIDMLKESQIDGVSISERKKYNEFCNLLVTDSRLKLILEKVDINKETIWDRNFKQYIDENFEQSWNEYKDMRNMVAHNKLICRTVKDRIIEHSELISTKLDEINQRLERIYKDNERTYVKEVYAQINEDFYIEEAGGSKLPDEEDVLFEIREDDFFSNMMNEIDEKLSELKDKREDVSWKIEQITGYYEDEDNIIEKLRLGNIYLILEMFELEKDDLKRICVSEINNQCVLNRFIPSAIENLHKLTEKLSDNGYFKVDSFDIGKLIEYVDIYGNKTELISVGMISPCRGDTDTIDVNMYVGDRLIESGVIEKQYFDYCIHEDEGYAMPEVDDYLDVRIDEVSSEILNKIINEIQVLDEVNQILESVFSDLIQ